MRRAHWGGYGVSKAALEGLVEILHQETDNTNVRAHALLPAPMRTALRRMAYFGEDTMQQPSPSVSAQAAIYLLSAHGVTARGAALDLREST
jgi:NAD(P)-dependent dehydrogenase (short-subunit alcohol dehydrogenase family)